MPEPTAAKPSRDPRKRIGRYTLLARIATGGMAEIYLARQQGVQGFEKLVVVKRILDSFAQDPEFVTMFLDEGRLAGQLSHPNIVQTFDLGEDQGNYFIAMEYVAGESIAKLARAIRSTGKLLDDRIAVRLIAQAAEALDYAHHRKDMRGKPLNIVHRDVSPQNLSVTYEGQLKVLDFGIAKAANRAAQTESGKVKGKFSYMSPEQALGKEIDGRSDVFALGIVAFELITGHRLLPGGDSAQTMLMIVGSEPLPRARERRASVDPGLEVILARAMDRDLQRRYATAGEFAAALNAWLVTQPPIGPGDVAAIMHELFEQEIAQRQQLIDRAMSSDDEIVEAEETQALTPSMPSGIDAGTVVSLERKKKWKQLGLRAGLPILAVAAGLGLWGIGRAGQPPPEAAATVPAAIVPVAPLAPIPVAAPPSKAAEATPTPEPAAKPKPSFGKLSIDTVPWTEVFWRGRSLGQTPLIGASLPSGAQQLTLKNPDQHLEQTIEIDIPKGGTATKHLRLQ